MLDGFAASLPTLNPPLLPFNIHHSLLFYSAPPHRDPLSGPQWLWEPHMEKMQSLPSNTHRQTLRGDTDRG